MTDPQEFLRGFGRVRVSKRDVLARLRVNREEHEAQYAEAIIGWREDQAKRLKDARLAVLRGSDDWTRDLYALKPENHAADYDHVIDLLTYSLDDEFELSAQEFAQYVRDEWAWKMAFTASTSNYIATR